MIIRLGTTILCAGTSRRAPATGLNACGILTGKISFPGGARQVQKVEYLRAPSAEFFDRGNATQEVRFTVWRQFATYPLAVTFRATHRAAVEGRKGTWWIQPEWPGDGISQTLYLPNGILREATHAEDPANAGVSVLTHYVLAGGLLTTLNPDT